MQYITIKGTASDSFIEKKSEFIGYIAHVETEDDAVRFINEVRLKHRKARHNVYAYKLRDGNISRYSDDGEPQGTGGVPILDVINKAELVDVCVVVTRYFGGVLLGTNGLVRAYSHACKLAAESAKKQVFCECAQFNAVTDYNMYSKISFLLPAYEAKMSEELFEENVKLKFFVKNEHIDDLKKELNDITGGKIQLDIKKDLWADFA
ncbi:MAG: YigZ family protein [Ruminococcus sp.]|nr:YigZ family protein [Ruminococcus sp.]